MYAVAGLQAIRRTRVFALRIGDMSVSLARCADGLDRCPDAEPTRLLQGGGPVALGQTMEDVEVVIVDDNSAVLVDKPSEPSNNESPTASGTLSSPHHQPPL